MLAGWRLRIPPVGTKIFVFVCAVRPMWSACSTLESGSNTWPPTGSACAGENIMLAVEIAVDSSRDKVRVVMVYPSPEFNEKIRILHENGHRAPPSIHPERAQSSRESPG